jgi:cobalt-zinc-cadmium efflux system outer membrane protein
MNKYLKIWSVLFVLPFSLLAQNDIDSVLSQIDKNNTTLSALRKSVEAEKIGNKTGIYLQNPEVGFNYLWSDPTSVGNRTDINVKQSFDFPTAYGYRRQISDSRNTQAELDYQKKRKNILLDARLLCAEIIYTNTLLEEYMERLAYAQDLADAYKVMYNSGEAGILENNKAQLNLLNIKKEVEAVKVEQSTYLKQLSALNGGKHIVLKSNALSLPPIPSDFDQWYNQSEQANPGLLWLNQEVMLSEHQTKLNRALTLPKASTGYMSENRVGEHFQGITVGVSIPLWENKNTVKYAEAKTLALSSVVADYKLQFYNQLRIQFEKAVSLQKTVAEYRQSLKLYENTGLLKIALDKGEISLLNYLMELSLAYSTIDKFMKAENELNKAVVLLYQYRD